MKISASLYSVAREKLVDSVKKLDKLNIDFFHIDSNDDLSVFDDIRKIRKISATPIDLHIISPEPEKYIEGIKELSVESVTVQYENLLRPFTPGNNHYTNWGLAIMTQTPISVFEHYKDVFSHILLMTTVPGKSGGNFDERNFEKIRAFKDKFPDKLIHVDGGVNEEISFILRNLGVYCAVSGSYLLKSEYLSKSLLKLKSDRDSMHYKISSFMKKTNELAIVKESELDLLEVLVRISEVKMGFCLVVNGNNELKGLITDGDLRRALIRHYSDFNELKKIDFINRNPFYIYDNENVKDMLEKVSRQSHNVNFVPVINHNHQLMGAVSFHNLIKGEL
ncbi:MAG: CBS domain-containing protein [Lentimicrobiaceae bacterium]|nr:CBS domain-containing protein [Lentimicrobiaceae bacterium]